MLLRRSSYFRRTSPSKKLCSRSVVAPLHCSTDNVANTISPGFNYRLSRTFLDFNETSMALDIESRELTKLYGIRFTFTNTGQGGKFDFAELTVTIGAGLALLVSARPCVCARCSSGSLVVTILFVRRIT